jgi:hypothetical protein
MLLTNLYPMAKIIKQSKRASFPFLIEFNQVACASI